MLSIAILILCVCVLHGPSAVVAESAEEDRIVSLPGLPETAPKFEHYSGYLKASETRNLHYWLE